MPLSGGVCKVVSYAILTPDAIAYRFRGKADFFVITGAMGHGYPKCAVALPEFDIFMTLPRYENNSQIQALSASLEACLENDGFHEIGEYRLAPIFGHINFAHILWNQIERLFELQRDYRRHVGRVIGSGMAFGEIDEIIPDFHCPTDTISIWNQTEYFAKNNLLPFRLGARSFSLQTKRELIRYLERVKSDAVADIDAMRKAHRQIFLLTMRQGRRTATNQAAFLEAVCRALAGRYPDSGFLFDSYSRPRVPQPGHIQQRGEEDVVLARKLASHIFEKIPAAGCCMAGLDIVDALYATLSIDYYISHHGTQQNKVSWLSSAPGFVHSNERYLAGPQNTPAIAEGTPQPRYISIDYIKEIDSGPAWIRDYEIDIDGAIAEILEDVETVLGMSGQSRKMPGE